MKLTYRKFVNIGTASTFNFSDMYSCTVRPNDILKVKNACISLVTYAYRGSLQHTA